jgi:leader peptidase (prepilin peptidase)/N-methyltransferase
VSRVADLAPSGSSVAKPDTGAEFVSASYGSASANVGSPLVFATRWFVLPLGSTAMFIVSWLVFDDFAGMLLGGFFGTVFLALTLTDLDRRLLPNRIIYPSIILAMALSWAWPNSDVAEIMAGGLAGVAVAVVLLLVSLPFGANALGLGDIKMIILIGFVVGLPSVLVAVFIGTLAGGVIAGFLLITRIRGRRDYIPHGPFLAIGALSAMWFGAEIWDAYRTN